MADTDKSLQLIEAWDRVDGAINRILTALPQQMTNAAETLEAERKGMREAIRTIMRKKATPCQHLRSQAETPGKPAICDDCGEEL